MVHPSTTFPAPSPLPLVPRTYIPRIALDTRAIRVPETTLAIALAVTPAVALYHWIHVCLWLAESTPGGSLVGLSAPDVAMAAGWPTTDAERFLSALQGCCGPDGTLLGWDTVSQPARRAAAKRQDQSTRNQGAAGAEAWSKPYADLWRATYGGEFSAYKHAFALKKLEATYGRDEVLRRWGNMLRRTEHQFAFAAKLAEGWGAYAEAGPNGSVRKQAAGALYQLIRTHGLFSRPDVRELAAELESLGTVESAEGLIAQLRLLDRDTVLNARSAEFAIKHIEERLAGPA